MLSLLVWSGIWTSHPSSVTTCGCGDVSQFSWFLAWPPYAITHDLNPFFSTFVNHPQGVNLLANTSVVALGIVLAPITWLFDPIATLNVALTLSPVASALAMYVLLRRWVRWAPAAFVGGLLYGFSPIVLVSLSNSWLNIGMIPVPPLVVLCLDELLFRQRRSPVKVGIGLGLLFVVQFFLSTEVLLVLIIGVAIALVLVAAYAAWREAEVLRQHFRHAIVGLAWGAIISVVLLAYPAWFALEGPAHLSGAIWGKFPFLQWHTNLKSFLVPAPGDSAAVASRHLIGGYQGPFLSNQYVGFGIVFVVLAGLIIWRQDRRLWLFGALAFCTVVLSLGVGQAIPLPWNAVANEPIFENIWPSRFLIGTYLALAVLVALIVDHVREFVRERSKLRGEVVVHARGDQSVPGVLAALCVAALAVIPTLAYLAQGLPITTRRWSCPATSRSLDQRCDRRTSSWSSPSVFGNRDSDDLASCRRNPVLDGWDRRSCRRAVLECLLESGREQPLSAMLPIPIRHRFRSHRAASSRSERHSQPGV